MLSRTFAFEVKRIKMKDEDVCVEREVDRRPLHWAYLMLGSSTICKTHQKKLHTKKNKLIEIRGPTGIFLYIVVCVCRSFLDKS